MPNFTLSEIATIVLVILIVFGPQRLPEMAQKAGALIRRGRTMVNDLKSEFDVEIREVTEPLKEVREELKGVSKDVSSSVTSLTDEVQQAKKEIEGQLQETSKEATDVVSGAKPAGTESTDGNAVEDGDNANSTDAEDGA